MDYLLFAAGLALLLLGGDRLVESAGSLARRSSLNPFAIGILVLGLGTSLPELVTSLDAALRGSPGLAIGNVVGSNIANILLVLGLSAVCAPIACEPASMRRQLPSVVVASSLALLAMQQGAIERWMGLGLAAALIVYSSVLLRASRRSGVAPEVPPGPTPTVPWCLFKAALSLGILLTGAHLVVTGALGIAQAHGVSETVIGLTVVAIGTSLPELTVTLLAVARRSAEIAVGGIIGSTIFNLLGILGVTALVTPIAVPEPIARSDVWVMVIAVFALVVFTRTGWRLSRTEGAVLLAGYPVYLGTLAL